AAKLADRPLHHLLADLELPGGATGGPAERVWVYAAGGYYYPDRGLDGLRDEMRGYLAQGYRTVKMKIGGAPLAEDLRRLEAVLEILPEGCTVAVDANGRFDTAQAVAYAEALRDYPVHWYEEPTDQLDYAALAAVDEVYPSPLATGENLFSYQDSRNRLRYDGLRSVRDVLQMDPALSYGFTEFRQTLAALAEDRKSVV